MGHTCDTLKIVIGRTPPGLSSVKRLSKPDWDRLMGAARALIDYGDPNAGLGLQLPSGANVVLRRMRDTKEVRGIFLTMPLGQEVLQTLLGSDPWWANAAFTLGRRVPMAIEPSPLPAPSQWVYGMARIPAGFVHLDQSAVSSSRGTTAIKNDEATPRVKPAPRAMTSAPAAMRRKTIRATETDHPYPLWVNWVCGGTTLASLLFLATALVLASNTSLKMPALRHTDIQIAPAATPATTPTPAGTP